LEKITLDGNDPLAEYSIDEGEEVLGEIADDWLKKIFVIFDQTSKNLQVIKNQLETLAEKKRSRIKKIQKGTDFVETFKAMKRYDLLRNIFWSATELACLNQFQFTNNLGVRSGWKIVKFPNQPEEKFQEEATAIAGLPDMIMDILEKIGIGGIRIIEIDIGRN